MPLVLNGTTGVQDNSGAFVAGTAVASTSGTSIDFTSIPSWVKRVTVMFDGVSTNGTSNFLIQVGDSGGVEATGYVSTSVTTDSTGGTAGASSTAGYIVFTGAAANTQNSLHIITNISGNTWVAMHQGILTTTNIVGGGGSKSTSATLDRVRITTVNGTDTFDAGSINILYE